MFTSSETSESGESSHSDNGLTTKRSGFIIVRLRGLPRPRPRSTRFGTNSALRSTISV